MERVTNCTLFALQETRVDEALARPWRPHSWADIYPRPGDRMAPAPRQSLRHCPVCLVNLGEWGGSGQGPRTSPLPGVLSGRHLPASGPPAGPLPGHHLLPRGPGQRAESPGHAQLWGRRGSCTSEEGKSEVTATQGRVPARGPCPEQSTPPLDVSWLPGTNTVVSEQTSQLPRGPEGSQAQWQALSLVLPRPLPRLHGPHSHQGRSHHPQASTRHHVPSQSFGVRPI